MFLRHCIETFLERTSPASSMAKPAAMNITRKPPIRNSIVLKMNCVETPTSAVTAGAAGAGVTGTTTVVS